jgi:DNA-binding MarR family transcriptional regulator
MNQDSFKKPLERLFLREKPVSAILAVEEIEHAYAALIAKRIDSTVPYTCSILRELEGRGLVSSRLQGRINYIELTDRGLQVVRALHELSDLFSEPDALRLRLERLRQIVSEAEGQRSDLRLGPLRRDLARIMSLGNGAVLRDAQELDQVVVAILNRL